MHKAWLLVILCILLSSCLPSLQLQSDEFTLTGSSLVADFGNASDIVVYLAGVENLQEAYCKKFKSGYLCQPTSGTFTINFSTIKGSYASAGIWLNQKGQEKIFRNEVNNAP